MGWATLSTAANRVAIARLGSVSVQAGAITGSGFKMEKSRFILDEEFTKIDVFLTVQTHLFGNLEYKTNILVDGDYYQVAYQPQRFDDGSWCEIPLIGPIPNPAVTVLIPWTTVTGQPITTVLGDEITLIRLG